MFLHLMELRTTSRLQNMRKNIVVELRELQDNLGSNNDGDESRVEDAGIERGFAHSEILSDKPAAAKPFPRVA